MNAPATSRATAAILPPGSTIGILGGGQLGRMTAMAAAQLGYRTVILTPETDAPATQVTDRTILANYDDEEALARDDGLRLAHYTERALIDHVNRVRGAVVLDRIGRYKDSR